MFLKWPTDQTKTRNWILTFDSLNKDYASMRTENTIVV